MNPKIIMHLGAHKTASTHLQRSLKKHQDQLTEAGFTYVTPKTCRDALFPVTMQLRDGGDIEALKKHASMLFHGAANGNPNVIISDENILGHLNVLFSKDLIYPWSHFRLARFFRLLPEHEFEMFISVRNLATFFPSAYVENLLHAKYTTFDAFLNNVDPWAFSWATMMRRFGNMSEGRKFNVWRYEDYGDVKSDVVAKMATPEIAQTIKFLKKHPRPILSHAAVDWYCQARTDGRTGRAVEILAEASELFPLGKQYPAFQPFTDQVIEKLTLKYESDLKIIANMGFVNLISPSD